MVRSLLNKEDPIGMMNSKAPHVFIVSDDFGRQKDMGIIRAAQRFRAAGMKVIGLFEEPESAESAGELCDETVAPPWRTADLHALIVAMTGEGRE